MHQNRRVRTWSLVALGATVVLPIAVACQPPENSQPPNVAGANTQYPGYPPGYGQPGYPPPGQTGYAPGTYPPPGQPTYPPPAGTPGQPVYPGTAAPGQPLPGTVAPGQPAPTGSAAPTLAPSDPNSLQGILQGIQNAMQGQTVPGGGGGVGGLDLTDVGLKAQGMRVAPGHAARGRRAEAEPPAGPARRDDGHAPGRQVLHARRLLRPGGRGGSRPEPPGAAALHDARGPGPLAQQHALIGGHPSEMCPVIAFPLQYKLDVVANKGSGIVAVQLFSKNK